jgi:predicted transcriptional regulator
MQMRDTTPDPNTIAWIFLSLELAASGSPAKIREISNVADGINHAVPEHHEMMHSISWLTKAGLAVKVGKAYALSERGLEVTHRAHENTDKMFQVWKNLEEYIREKTG